MKLDDLASHVDHFRRRVLADAIQEATAAYWRRRAETFAAVGTPACDEIAQACRNHATVMLGGDVPAQIICPTCGTPTSPWTCSCGETRIGDAA